MSIKYFSEVPDLKDISVSKKSSAAKRTEEFINKTGNPYVFKTNGVVVEVDFNQSGKSLTKSIADILNAG